MLTEHMLKVIVQTWPLKLLTIFPNSQRNAVHDSCARGKHCVLANLIYLELELTQGSQSRMEPGRQSPSGEQGLYLASTYAGLRCCSHTAGNKSVGPTQAHPGRAAEAMLASLVAASGGPAVVPLPICPQPHRPDASCQLSIHQGGRTGDCVTSLCLLSSYLLLWGSFEPPNSCRPLSR